MTKLRLLSTAAAIVLIGTAAAAAQELKKDEAPARAPAAQQNAPAEKLGPAVKHGAPKAELRKPPETTGQGSPQKLEPGRSGDTPMDEDSGVKGGVTSPKANSPTPNSPKAMGRESGIKSEQRDGANAEVKSNKTSTTGQGAASGAAKLSTEQRTKITTIIRAHKVAPARLNISVHVGTRVPDSVHFYPLPPEVFVIYPEWRGYDYIMVGEEILVVDPRTHEIVAIIDA